MLVKIQARASMQHRFPIPLAASWRQGTTVLIANSALHRKHSAQENQEDELLILCQGNGHHLPAAASLWQVQEGALAYGGEWVTFLEGRLIEAEQLFLSMEEKRGRADNCSGSKYPKLISTPPPSC